MLFKIQDKILLSKAKKSGILCHRVSLNEYKYYLNKMIFLAKKHHIKVILLTRPFIGESPNEFWWKNYAPRYNELTLEIAKERNIPVIDLHCYFKTRTDKFSDESHFNDTGHREAAEIVYSFIRNRL